MQSLHIDAHVRTNHTAKLPKLIFFEAGNIAISVTQFVFWMYLYCICLQYYQSHMSYKKKWVKEYRYGNILCKWHQMFCCSTSLCVTSLTTSSLPLPFPTPSYLLFVSLSFHLSLSKPIQFFYSLLKAFFQFCVFLFVFFLSQHENVKYTHILSVWHTLMRILCAKSYLT